MPRETKRAPSRAETRRRTGDAMRDAASRIEDIATSGLPIEAYTHRAEPPDPVTTIGVWQAEAITIRRRDDNQAMLLTHVIDWLARNPGAQISSGGKYPNLSGVLSIIQRTKAYISHNANACEIKKNTREQGMARIAHYFE